MNHQDQVPKAVVVAQLVEQSLPTPEIHGLNPNIGKFYITMGLIIGKDENKEKEAGNGQICQIWYLGPIQAVARFGFLQVR